MFITNNTFDLKDVNTLQIGTPREPEAYKSVKVSGSTLTLKMFSEPPFCYSLT